MFTYPAELSKEGRLKVARIVARYLVSTSAVAVDFNIHEPGKDGDETKLSLPHHVHHAPHDGQGPRGENAGSGTSRKDRAEAVKGGEN